MLRPIQEILAQTMESIQKVRACENQLELKDQIFEKKEHLRLAYLQEDWTQAIMIANDLLDLPLSTMDKEQALWTRRKAGEHLAAKAYL